MSLATTNSAPNALAHRPLNASEVAALTLENVWWLAEKVAATRMFPGLVTPEAVFTMMMICQSRGLHPIEAIMRYDIIENKPALKAATIQAEFQSRGGRIKIIRTDAIEARAFFSHPTLQPEGFEFHVTYEQFKESKLIFGKDGVKKNWRENPADMLWWRLVSKAIRKIDPGIVVGLPSSEELRDEIDRPFETAPQVTLAATVTTAEGAPVQVAEATVPGQAAPGVDSRTYPELVKDGVEAINAKIFAKAKERGGEIPEALVEVSVVDVNRFMANEAIQSGFHTGGMPNNGREAATMLGKVYKQNRDWVRSKLKGYLEEQLAHAESLFAKPKEAVTEAVEETAEISAPEQPKQEAPKEEAKQAEEPTASEPPPVPPKKGGKQQAPQRDLLGEPGMHGPDD